MLVILGKIRKYLLLATPAFFSFLVYSGMAEAQTALLRISPTEIAVQIDGARPSKNWSFRNVSGAVLGLGSRIESFQAQTGNHDLSVTNIAPGEFRADHLSTQFSYKVKLPPPRNADVSHATWLSATGGILMFADVVPEGLGEISAAFELPDEWRVHSAITPDSNGRYQVDDPEKAVFVVGRSIRKSTRTVDGSATDVLVMGSWPISEGQIQTAASRILKKYVVLTGYRLPKKSAIILAPLPSSGGSTTWKAETRGSTVMLLIDPHARFKSWSAQLGVIFTHELLHLWVPNSLRLQGDYDWFFEGFTLYTALLTALDLKLINFGEYLNTLGRVYDSYLSTQDTLSLIEASERRWTNNGATVYEKGMLVAFLYDLTVRKESKGKSSVLNVYQPLFKLPSVEPEDGNEVIIKLLTSSPATEAFARSHIETRSGLNLEELLSGYGFRVSSNGNKSTIEVNQRLTPDELTVLRSLGYRD